MVSRFHEEFCYCEGFATHQREKSFTTGKSYTKSATLAACAFTVACAGYGPALSANHIVIVRIKNLVLPLKEGSHPGHVFFLQLVDAERRCGVKGCLAGTGLSLEPDGTDITR